MKYEYIIKYSCECGSNNSASFGSQESEEFNKIVIKKFLAEECPICKSEIILIKIEKKSINDQESDLEKAITELPFDYTKELK